MLFLLCLLSGLELSAQTQVSPGAVPLATEATGASADGAIRALAGVWENATRFVEIRDNQTLRIVLKPYYGFVYEDSGFMPCALSSDAEGVFALSLAYEAEKKSFPEIPVTVIGNGMYFNFMRRYIPPAEISTDTQGSTDAKVLSALDGFWVAAGNTDSLKLYRSEPVTEFFSYYFAGNTYYRIRYWITDARIRDSPARFPGPDGSELSVPKFIQFEGVLYTCVTSTGKILRNYEKGTFELTQAEVQAIFFTPEKIVFKGTAAALMHPVRISLSADGSVLAFGEPALVRSQLADLDAEITAHNGLRRPPRKPLLEFMDLDFRWDDIAAIRNHGEAPEETGK